MESLLIEAQLRERFIDVSCKKLAVAKRGGADPLRKSLHVLTLLREVHQTKKRLEIECSVLLYLPITPIPPSRQRRSAAPSRMVVVIEQAPPQRIAPVPVVVPTEPEPVLDIEMEFLEEDDVEIVEEGHDGGSMQRKRKANGSTDADPGRRDSKHRYRNDDDATSSK